MAENDHGGSSGRPKFSLKNTDGSTAKNIKGGVGDADLENRGSSTMDGIDLTGQGAAKSKAKPKPFWRRMPFIVAVVPVGGRALGVASDSAIRSDASRVARAGRRVSGRGRTGNAVRESVEIGTLSASPVGMDPRVLARRLLQAEREYRQAQLRLDGSERARRRYAVASAYLRIVEAQVEYRLRRLVEASNVRVGS